MAIKQPSDAVRQQVISEDSPAPMELAPETTSRNAQGWTYSQGGRASASDEAPAATSTARAAFRDIAVSKVFLDSQNRLLPPGEQQVVIMNSRSTPSNWATHFLVGDAEKRKATFDSEPANI